MVTCDNRGVSSVIGVILMVAIAVILASLVALFVVSDGGLINESPPTVDLEGEVQDGELIVTHDSGQEVQAQRVGVFVNGERIDENEDVINDEKDVFGAGDEVARIDVDDGDTVNIVWGEPITESSDRLRTFNV